MHLQIQGISVFLLLLFCGAATHKLWLCKYLREHRRRLGASSVCSDWVIRLSMHLPWTLEAPEPLDLGLHCVSMWKGIGFRLRFHSEGFAQWFLQCPQWHLEVLTPCVTITAFMSHWGTALGLTCLHHLPAVWSRQISCCAPDHQPQITFQAHKTECRLNWPNRVHSPRLHFTMYLYLCSHLS